MTYSCNSKRLLSLLAAGAFTVLFGRITDKTTGQALAGVLVSATSANTKAQARTGADGRFTLRALRPGTYSLHLVSGDVPPQTLQVTVKGAKEHLDLQACSTTLDYSCGSPSGGGG